MTVGLARKLNRTKSHRDAMLRNLVTELFQHGSIVSTHEKCKEASRLAERIVTWSKNDTSNGAEDSFWRRNIQSKLFLSGNNSKLLNKVYNELKPAYLNRKSGYTRILHLEPRFNDSARQSILELVDYPILKGTSDNIQKGNIKLWLLIKSTLYDEGISKSYNELTLKNLYKQTLFKDKETFRTEVKIIRKLIKEDQNSIELSQEELDLENSQIDSLLNQIYQSKELQTSKGKSIPGVAFLESRPERSLYTKH